MKLTVKKLRQIIKEEISSVNQRDDGKYIELLNMFEKRIDNEYEFASRQLPNIINDLKYMHKSLSYHSKDNVYDTGEIIITPKTLSKTASDMQNWGNEYVGLSLRDLKMLIEELELMVEETY